ncbi:MAG: TIR domain-containing protein [Chloroflexota bacterium]|nr:TIR domain-containing protein [Chloroflexota bacterium]
MTTKPYYFVSYSRKDVDIVREFVDKLRIKGVETWIDIDQLSPGVEWAKHISKALHNATGLILFISSASLKSDWVMREFQYIFERGEKVYPILLEDTELPFNLARIQFINLRDKSHINLAVDELVRAISHTAKTKPTIDLKQGEIAQIALETRTELIQPPPLSAHEEQKIPPSSVFVVHGRDIQFLEDVEHHLVAIGVQPVVLAKTSNEHQMSILQKFLVNAGKADFAIVLMSPDDYGALVEQFDAPNVGDRALKFRARQNVILELGFFYGKLGFENVFILAKSAGRIFPDFEPPSDIASVPFDTYDASGKWKDEIRKRLRQAGFTV